jgi:hypothetical protein
MNVGHESIIQLADCNGHALPLHALLLRVPKQNFQRLRKQGLIGLDRPVNLNLNRRVDCLNVPARVLSVVNSNLGITVPSDTETDKLNQTRP